MKKDNDVNDSFAHRRVSVVCFYFKMNVFSIKFN